MPDRKAKVRQVMKARSIPPPAPRSSSTVYAGGSEGRGIWCSVNAFRFKFNILIWKRESGLRNKLKTHVARAIPTTRAESILTLKNRELIHFGFSSTMNCEIESIIYYKELMRVLCVLCVMIPDLRSLNINSTLPTTWSDATPISSCYQIRRGVASVKGWLLQMASARKISPCKRKWGRRRGTGFHNWTRGEG